MTKNAVDPAGESLESFLDEVGLKEEVYATATKAGLAWQMEELRKAQGITKTDMASRMGTSRSQLDRVLDPENVAVSLEMMAKAAHAVGRQLRIELVETSQGEVPTRTD